VGTHPPKSWFMIVSVETQADHGALSSFQDLAHSPTSMQSRRTLAPFLTVSVETVCQNR